MWFLGASFVAFPMKTPNIQTFLPFSWLFIKLAILLCQLNTKRMTKVKKNRINARIQRKITKEYRDVMKNYSLLPVVPFASEWQKQGDFFVQFSLFDETQRSFATNSTTILSFYQ
jgi:hypothetical protein